MVPLVLLCLSSRKLSSLRVGWVKERSQPRNHFPSDLQSIREARGLRDQPSSSAGNSLSTTGACGVNQARCALLTLQRGISLLYLHLQPPPPRIIPMGGGADPPLISKMRRLRAPKALWFPVPRDPLYPLCLAEHCSWGSWGRKCGQICLPIPSQLASTVGPAHLLCPARRGLQQGGGVLPAAVVMPRSRQVYSSPVQNTCSFMVPGQGQRPSRAGSSGSGPRCSQTSCVQGGCGCQLGALVPWGPAVPNQSQPLQPGRGVNGLTFLPAACAFARHSA